jgi:hypothetical protein
MKKGLFGIPPKAGAGRQDSKVLGYSRAKISFALPAKAMIDVDNMP